MYPDTSLLIRRFVMHILGYEVLIGMAPFRSLEAFDRVILHLSSTKIIVLLNSRPIVQKAAKSLITMHRIKIYPALHPFTAEWKLMNIFRKEIFHIPYLGSLCLGRN